MKAEEKLVETAASAPAAEEEPYPPAGYAWHVVGALTFVYMFSFIDWQILNLLVAPIRRDLVITDTQMSWLMGPAFRVLLHPLRNRLRTPDRFTQPADDHRGGLRDLEPVYGGLRSGEYLFADAAAARRCGNRRGVAFTGGLFADHRLFPAVLVQFFDRTQTKSISTSPYAASTASHTRRIMAPGAVISDVSNCPFLILFANSIPLKVTSAFPNVLNHSIG